MTKSFLSLVQQIKPETLIILTPLIFLVTQNSTRPYFANSILLTYIAVLFIHLSLTGNKLYPTTKTSFYLVLLISLFLASSLLHPNPLESLFTDKRGIILVLLFSYYLIQSGTKITKRIIYSYLGLITLISCVYIFSSLLNPKFSRITIVTLASPLELTTLLIISIITLGFLYQSSKKRILLVFLSALAVFTGIKSTQIELSKALNYNKTYSSLVESLRDPKDFMLGSSPGRFQDFITKHSSVSHIYNTTSAIPTYSQSGLLEQVMTTGILFTSLFLYGLWKEYQSISKDIDLHHNIHQLNTYLVPAFVILLAFTPITTITFYFFALLYGYIKQDQKVNKHLPIDQRLLSNNKLVKPLNFLSKAIIITASVFLIYMGAKSTLGEFYYSKYQDYAQQDQYLLAYDNLRNAISSYPFRADFHSQYSVTNIVLAAKLISENGLGNEQDRSNITELYQQAIREALNSTKLEPNSSVNWHNLGIIYRELIGFAENSLTYAEAAYFSAIKLSPKNPMLWIDLGYTYFKAEKFTDSCNANRNASTLKPDWYLPYLNLALCSQKLNQTDLAKEYLDKALTLTEVNTPEYQEVSTAINSLK